MRPLRPRAVRQKGTHVVDEITVENGEMKWRDRLVSKQEWENQNVK